MANEMNGPGEIDSRMEWVDPKVTTLELMETAGNPGRGGQPSRYIDCTRS